MGEEGMKMDEIPKALPWANTSCWDCSAVYPAAMPECPACGAHNANMDMKAALEQMQRRQSERPS